MKCSVQRQTVAWIVSPVRRVWHNMRRFEHRWNRYARQRTPHPIPLKNAKLEHLLTRPDSHSGRLALTSIPIENEGRLI